MTLRMVRRRTARETHIIDGARENAQAVGAGAKALRGWASILGGSSVVTRGKSSKQVAERDSRDDGSGDGGGA